MGSLLPMRCLLCEAWGFEGLCAHCRRLHQPHSSRPRCPACGLRLALGVPRCADCERQPPAHEGVRVAVDYVHPWDRVMMQLKFGGRPDAAPALALLMADAVRHSVQAGMGAADGLSPRVPIAPARRPTRVVPVPLSPERLRKRGYNQAWELARPLARTLGLPARPDVLRRPVDLAGQAEQTRQARLQRLEGVFEVSRMRRPWLAGQVVALVDDVLTTGATVAEAARTLMAAGADAVQVWAFARTPPPEEGPS